MTQAVADPPPRYRIPSTIQSYPQWRTVRRSGAQVRLPERNVRIIWLEDKLHVWKDPQHRLWWMRCDRCLVSGRGAFAVSRGWRYALTAALRHAAVHHNVHI